MYFAKAQRCLEPSCCTNLQKKADRYLKKAVFARKSSFVQ